MSKKEADNIGESKDKSKPVEVEEDSASPKRVIFQKMKPLSTTTGPSPATTNTIGPSTPSSSITSGSGLGGTSATNTGENQSLPPVSDESNSPNVECFQNFTAPEVFIQGLAGMVNQQDVETIIKSQRYMLQRFEKTNEMLVNCNELAAVRFQHAMQDFKKHIQLLKEFHKDMDNVFKRIRVIKAKLASQYPQQFEAAASVQRKEKSLSRGDEDDDDEEE